MGVAFSATVNVGGGAGVESPPPPGDGGAGVAVGNRKSGLANVEIAMPWATSRRLYNGDCSIANVRVPTNLAKVGSPNRWLMTSPRGSTKALRVLFNSKAIHRCKVTDTAQPTGPYLRAANNCLLRFMYLCVPQMGQRSPVRWRRSRLFSTLG